MTPAAEHLIVVAAHIADEPLRSRFRHANGSGTDSVLLLAGIAGELSAIAALVDAAMKIEVECAAITATLSVKRS